MKARCRRKATTALWDNLFFFFFANEEGTDVFVCVGKREATVAWRVQATREVSL